MAITRYRELCGEAPDASSSESITMLSDLEGDD